ncbi:MAG TPA: glutaredoxin 3 [Spongiibacteraceae bacterium]|nr:glutaredoxin 3 [Spongiibacteraceae bacterium]
MAEVTIYTTRYCPYCIAAKRLLDSKGVKYDEIAVDGNRELRAEMEQRSGGYTVPQIWIGAQHVGGCDDLYALEHAGQLDGMLKSLAQ